MNARQLEKLGVPIECVPAAITAIQDVIRESSLVRSGSKDLAVTLVLPDAVLTGLAAVEAEPSVKATIDSLKASIDLLKKPAAPIPGLT